MAPGTVSEDAWLQPATEWVRVHSIGWFCMFMACSSVSLAAIGRTLIPRYFSTVFEGGVTDLYYILKHSKESFHNSSITVDCDQCAMVTQHGKPMFTKVRPGLGTNIPKRKGVQLLLQFSS